jgi:hypothetical protein
VIREKQQQKEHHCWLAAADHEPYNAQETVS